MHVMKRGFSLIELLVAMAIIALLATTIIAGVTHMQTKSRDTRRVEDISQISKALELYYSSEYRFPKAETEVVLNNVDDILTTTLIPAGAISSISLDPIHPDYTYRYQTNSLGTTYTLRFCLETDSIKGYSAGCSNEKTP